MRVEPAIILDGNGKENPWRRAGRLWVGLRPESRVLICVVGAALSLIFIAVASTRPSSSTPVGSAESASGFVPITYEQYSAKRCRDNDWAEMTDEERHWGWEIRVSCDRSEYEWKHDPAKRAEVEKRCKPFVDNFCQQWADGTGQEVGGKKPRQWVTAPQPYPYVTGSDPRELNGPDFAAP